MTIKLVERLREPNRKQLPDWPEDLLTDAADEIERLCSACKQLAMPKPRPMTPELESVMNDYDLWPPGERS